MSLLCDREKVRQLELPSTLAAKTNPAFSTPSSRPQLAAAAAPSQALVAADGRVAAVPSEVQLQLNQDLVAATVKLDSASRRLEVLERERERLNRSLEDAQVAGHKMHTHKQLVCFLKFTPPLALGGATSTTWGRASL